VRSDHLFFMFPRHAVRVGPIPNEGLPDIRHFLARENSLTPKMHVGDCIDVLSQRVPAKLKKPFSAEHRRRIDHRIDAPIHLSHDLFVSRQRVIHHAARRTVHLHSERQSADAEQFRMALKKLELGTKAIGKTCIIPIMDSNVFAIRQLNSSIPSTRYPHIDRIIDEANLILNPSVVEVCDLFPSGILRSIIENQPLKIIELSLINNRLKRLFNVRFAVVNRSDDAYGCHAVNTS